MKRPVDLFRTAPQNLNVLIWGTYDLGKPRTRLVIQSIRETGAQVSEIHSAVWEGAEDKSVLRKGAALRRVVRWLLAYPGLLWRFCRAPRPDVVVIGYLGHLDVLSLLPFAAIRRIPIVWDAFLSLHDTVVRDRKMISRRNPAALFLWALEWLACRAVNRVVLDTEAHAELFRCSYGLEPRKLASVFVGAEAEAFPTVSPKLHAKHPTVLFYGQFIPLHGIETIVEAARMAGDQEISWVIIGRGQQTQAVQDMTVSGVPASIEWVEWVPYPELVQRIGQADVCLGVFGESEKAGRVIPNKVFQILSAGKPLVTRTGPGILELVSEDTPGVELVPPGDPAALLAAVKRLLSSAPYPPELHADLRKRFSIDILAAGWDAILRKATSS
ncbi:glycosyltransferase [Alisedimentitalea sp. MJ-SS2]|uniref:glycosyltransferase n=1 Tax=Aliisedimentitalea sp. MJ-SS2 TaxID=3049795 RepID=UPI002909B419|nr:glycosyltransferase [Alisedimentitalea sp. MJ-SS2]MDU8928289.1 glycosyltransferase [Alisedimentitalea sp. MJ-SS2]